MKEVPGSLIRPRLFLNVWLNLLLHLWSKWGRVGWSERGGAGVLAPIHTYQPQSRGISTSATLRKGIHSIASFWHLTTDLTLAQSILMICHDSIFYKWQNFQHSFDSLTVSDWNSLLWYSNFWVWKEKRSRNSAEIQVSAQKLTSFNIS